MQNDTGCFQELAHADDVKFSQLSILKVNAGCKRGDHYHTRKEEWFCCIHGNCVMEMRNVRTGERRAIGLSGCRREFELVKPYENHIVDNSDGFLDCELLVISSEVYNPNDPDTFQEEVEDG